MFKWLTGLVGDSNESEVRAFAPTVERVNELEPDVEALSDEEMRAKTDEFRSRLETDETLDDILPEAFAVVREMVRRLLGERAFDVQLIGATVLHQGKIAEMKTGEGKTLVATLPLYLTAIVNGMVTLARAGAGRADLESVVETALGAWDGA